MLWQNVASPIEHVMIGTSSLHLSFGLLAASTWCTFVVILLQFFCNLLLFFVYLVHFIIILSNKLHYL